MPLVARRKSTGEIVNDFQSHATREILEANAVSSGLPIADLEFLQITDEELAALYDTHPSVSASKIAAEHHRVSTKIVALNAMRKIADVCNLDKEEVKGLVAYIVQLSSDEQDEV